MQKLIATVIGLFLITAAFKEVDSNVKREDIWQSWDEVIELSRKEKKPILIDVYTNWCRYCKLMDRKTYTHDSVKAYLESNYYRFKFNAESKTPIVWMGETFDYTPTYKVHEFAMYLTNNRLAYPTTVIITPDGIPHVEAGVINPAQFELILKYFSNQHYKKSSIEQFAANFKSNWK